MDTIMFCRACGHFTYYDRNATNSLSSKPNERCPFCKRGRYVDTGIDGTKAYGMVLDASLEKYNCHPNELSNDKYAELHRELFFYGKFDSQSDSTSVTKGRKLEKITRDNLEREANAPVPKCPICGSTNLKKLSVFGKVAKVKMFGIFGAGNLGKTYKCEDCGVKF